MYVRKREQGRAVTERCSAFVGAPTEWTRVVGKNEGV